VLAMGCRERTRGNLMIPGARGAGVLTAGAAQRYLNINGYLPGKKIVILGSGDIGLIMARQFVLEGAEVKALVEVMPYSGGLPRNMKQCIEDFDIPVYYNSTVSQIKGKERVSSVMVSKVDEKRKPIPGTEFEIECDTLMISAGLIPENELTEQAGIKISGGTKGAVVTEDLQTSAEGFFACGNVLHVHDLVDFVAEEGEEAGRYAAQYILQDKKEQGEQIRIVSGAGAGAAVPQLINKNTSAEKVAIMFRPRNRYRDVTVTAEMNGSEIARKKLVAVTPGEMIKLEIPAEKLAAGGDEIVVSLEGGAI
ncbi:MAG: pyridine nucleotide-disulfide oxidoreductase, partial [Clostridiales bacterium]|nr:pyridine nucleotide-disulfide oxidoreductase [Clostridiales bacterium]